MFMLTKKPFVCVFFFLTVKARQGEKTEKDGCIFFPERVREPGGGRTGSQRELWGIWTEVAKTQRRLSGVCGQLMRRGKGSRKAFDL